jgi:hypothetical protein
MSTKQIQNSFRQSVSDANSIIKRGEYDKLQIYQQNMTALMLELQEANIPKDEKAQLQQNLQEYLALINDITHALQKNAPLLNAHYNETIKGLNKFNKKIASIGFGDLTSKWMRLSRLKNNFLKKPTQHTEKEFYDTYNAIVVTLTELYLDEEIETPMLSYLEEYKSYFTQIALSYQNINYNKITNIKPLCYKIKAQLEFSLAQES